VLFSLSSAQNVTKKVGSGRGYFITGWSTLDVTKLNDRLTSHGYPEFSNSFISIGGGGHVFIKNKLVIGGQGHTLIGSEKTSGSLKSTISAGYGVFDIGYIIYSRKDLNIYPLLGFGGGGLTLKIAEDSSPAFDDILANPKRSVELIYGGFVLNLSLGIDYFVKMGEDEEGVGGLVFGLQGGYMLAPITHDWKIDENDVNGGPEIGFGGPYVKVMIGGGGRSK